MTKYKDLKDKVVVISGAAGNLAQDLIIEYIKNDAIIFGLDNDIKKLNSNFKKIKLHHPNSKIFSIKCNIALEQEVIKVIKSIFKKFKRIDILVNNAATKTKNLKNFFKNFQNFNFKDWKEIMGVNIDGAFLLSREISKIMISQKSGNIVSIASIQGVLGNDKRLYKSSKFKGVQMSSPAVYSTSKSALIGLTRYLSTFLGEYNIRANSISPGGLLGGQNKTFIRNYSKKVPLKRMGKIHEVVESILFLSSEKSSYITGQNILVDGGYTAW
jgi:NAD(P)-dependent dehydrogenase (short-subunit alcohol dehydrogenase family)